MQTNAINFTHSGLSLDQLKVGELGFVGKINAFITSTIPTAFSNHFQDDALARRLMELGFIPGEPLQVLHKSFWRKGPIAVRIGQSTFALRRFEAALISVIPHCKK